jgi:hypothetical protein
MYKLFRRRGWVVSVKNLPLYLQERETGSGCVRKISPPTGVRTTDYPARSESLYRLNYPGHQFSTFWSSTKKNLQFLADDVNKFKLLGRSQNCEKRLLASCPSVRLHGTTRLPLDGVWLHLILEYFQQNVSRKFKFHQNLRITTGTLHGDL